MEAQCEIAADTGEWHEVNGLVALARAEALRCGLEALPCWVDRLEGARALGAGDTEGAIEFFRRASLGFERLGARWDLARSDLALAQALKETGRAQEAAALLQPGIAFFAKVGAKPEHEAALLIMGVS